MSSTDVCEMPAPMSSNDVSIAQPSQAHVTAQNEASSLRLSVRSSNTPGRGNTGMFFAIRCHLCTGRRWVRSINLFAEGRRLIISLQRLNMAELFPLDLDNCHLRYSGEVLRAMSVNIRRGGRCGCSCICEVFCRRLSLVTAPGMTGRQQNPIVED